MHAGMAVARRTSTDTKWLYIAARRAELSGAGGSAAWALLLPAHPHEPTATPTAHRHMHAPRNVRFWRSPGHRHPGCWTPPRHQTLINPANVGSCFRPCRRNWRRAPAPRACYSSPPLQRVVRHDVARQPCCCLRNAWSDPRRASCERWAGWTAKLCRAEGPPAEALHNKANISVRLAAQLAWHPMASDGTLAGLQDPWDNQKPCWPVAANNNCVAVAVFCLLAGRRVLDAYAVQASWSGQEMFWTHTLSMASRPWAESPLGSRVFAGVQLIPGCG